MSKEQIMHDLATAMAQVYLQEYRNDPKNAENLGYSEETIFFIKSYFSSFEKISEEYDDKEENK